MELNICSFGIFHDIGGKREHRPQNGRFGEIGRRVVKTGVSPPKRESAQVCLHENILICHQNPYNSAIFYISHYQKSYLNHALEFDIGILWVSAGNFFLFFDSEELTWAVWGLGEYILPEPH